MLIWDHGNNIVNCRNYCNNCPAAENNPQNGIFPRCFTPEFNFTNNGIWRNKNNINSIFSNNLMNNITNIININNNNIRNVVNYIYNANINNSIINEIVTIYKRRQTLNFGDIDIMIAAENPGRYDCYDKAKQFLLMLHMLHNNIQNIPNFYTFVFLAEVGYLKCYRNYYGVIKENLIKLFGASFFANKKILWTEAVKCQWQQNATANNKRATIKTCLNDFFIKEIDYLQIDYLQKERINKKTIIFLFGKSIGVRESYKEIVNKNLSNTVVIPFNHPSQGQLTRQLKVLNRDPSFIYLIQQIKHWWQCKTNNTDKIKKLIKSKLPIKPIIC